MLILWSVFIFPWLIAGPVWWSVQCTQEIRKDYELQLLVPSVEDKMFPHHLLESQTHTQHQKQHFQKLLRKVFRLNELVGISPQMIPFRKKAGTSVGKAATVIRVQDTQRPRRSVRNLL